MAVYICGISRRRDTQWDIETAWHHSQRNLKASLLTSPYPCHFDPVLYRLKDPCSSFQASFIPPTEFNSLPRGKSWNPLLAASLVPPELILLGGEDPASLLGGHDPQLWLFLGERHELSWKEERIWVLSLRSNPKQQTFGVKRGRQLVRHMARVSRSQRYNF